MHKSMKNCFTRISSFLLRQEEISVRILQMIIMKSEFDIIILPCAEKVSMLLNPVIGTFQKL